MNESIITQIKTIKDWARLVIELQDACNLSGVIHSFSSFITWLRKTYPDQDTQWYNNHPICVLFINKIQSLSYSKGFASSYLWCKDVVDDTISLEKIENYN